MSCTKTPLRDRAVLSVNRILIEALGSLVSSQTSGNGAAVAEATVQRSKGISRQRFMKGGVDCGDDQPTRLSSRGLHSVIRSDQPLKSD